ncbi:hypothetical protein PC123_g20914 [Phytophthora cactorum]|nr:hypothetical protein PC123_g20914 [Phytophthora cactorum]
MLDPSPWRADRSFEARRGPDPAQGPPALFPRPVISEIQLDPVEAAQ